MSAVDLARTLVASCIAAGVRDVVLAPGSRSGGLALTLAAADQRGDVRLHVLLDERGAGFFALGLAKGSGSPVVVVTTSGTAVANLAPAVAEARASGVPLVVVAADRPVSLHDSGANQTTRQVGLFGDLPVAVVRLSSESGAPLDWHWAVQRAVTLASGARTRQPGPVHLNVELHEPLVAPEVFDPLPTMRAAEVLTSPPMRATTLDDDLRTVVLVGDASPEVGQHARSIAERSRLPLLAEPSSNARAGDHAIAHYRTLLDRHLGQAIERVVLLGHPTLSRPVSRLLARADLEVVVVSALADPPVPGMRGLRVVDDLALPPAEPEWLASWQEADATEVAAQPHDAWSAFTIAERVWRSCADQQLVVGSSATIRHLDLARVSQTPPVVWANRGLSGIDGTLHTAAGIAQAHSSPTTVLLGDLTFLHDLTGLLVGVHEHRPPLRIVVIDDHGGAIFHGLEQGAPVYAEHFERVFATPQGVDLAQVAAGFGVDVVEVSSITTLDDALALPRDRTRVIRAQVDRGLVTS